jgi:hypothetical protein
VEVVDGTRDRPPGKTAENWSRKDHIRAGSVSGPWRSAPRAEAPPDPVVAAAPEPAPVVRPVHAPRPHVELAELRRGPQPDGRKRRAVVMSAWIAFGVLFAAACVVAAFMFQPVATGVEAEGPAEVVAPEPAPVPAPTDQARVTPAPPAGAAADPGEQATVTPAPAAAATDPALSGIADVRLRIGPAFPAERRDAIVAALTAAGIDAVRVEPLPFKVATSRVGYYRAEDLPAAEALARLIAPVAVAGTPMGVRDYGQLLAAPEPGRLDLWVGG